MLSIMRRQAGSWMIKVLLFAIVVVFMFWGVGSFRSRETSKVADVNGEIVTYEIYRQSYDRMRDQYRRAYGNSFDEQMFKALNLQQKALDQIVNRILMVQEAQDLNIRVADETLDEAIEKIPAFQKNGAFNEAQATFVLSQSRLTTAEFRNSLREGMLIDKLQAVLVKGVTVTEGEARDWYDWNNAEVDLNYLQFSSSRYSDIPLSDEEISEFFKANENNYLTDPQVKVSYLFFDPGAYEDPVEVLQDRIETYYSRHPDEFKSEKTVEARHILLKLDADTDEKTVAEKEQEAVKIQKMAVQGEPFEELAKKYSEGPTKDKGGYLGAFKKDAMVKPFADKAFSMKSGEISEPVRTQFGWHIIKVEKVNEANTQSLEEATAAIREKLATEDAKALALKKAEDIYNSVFDGDDLAVAAQSHKLNIKTTDFFTARTFKEKGIGDTKLFVDTAFGLTKMAISDVIDLGAGYGLLQVVALQEAAVPSLDVVIERVRADLTKKRQKELAKTDAEACLSELQQGKGLEEAGDRFDLKPSSTGGFKRNGSIPGIGYDPQLSEAAFALRKDKPLAEKVFEGKQGWSVIQLKERKPPEADGFAKEKDDSITQLTEQKKQAAIQQWLQDAKARGKVDVNYELIR